jgi:hypothetical protein
VLDNINTEAAEQCFAWLRKYAAVISSMNWLRAPVFLLVLFHLKNLSYVRRRPSDIFPIVSSENICTKTLYFPHELFFSNSV